MAADAARHGSVLLFAKAPRPGRVKTRLQPPLGEQQAAAVARALLAGAANRLRAAPAGWEAVLCADDPHDPFLRGLAAVHGFRILAQGRGNLGTRMGRACAAVLARSPAVIVVGADCPGLDAGYLHQAVAALAGPEDVVLGPALDGGYVLIGMRAVHPRLFTRIRWGSDTVAAEQRRRIAALGLHCRELPVRADVDRFEDLWQVCPALPGPPQALAIGRLSP